MKNGKNGNTRLRARKLWLIALLLLTTSLVRAQVSTSAVYQNGAGSLILCNNLILNNGTDYETNVASVPSSNILGGDIYSFFEDPDSSFIIMVGSPAHNAGDDQCVDWNLDLKGEARRTCGSRVDVGAYEVGPIEHSALVTANVVMDEWCNGRSIALTATGGQYYQWSHSDETVGTVLVNPQVTTCYTVTAYWDGDCPWNEPATICVDPENVSGDLMVSSSTSGQRFWVSFMKNHIETPTISLLISAQNACSGSITNPNTGWSIPFTVAANSTTQIPIPIGQAYCRNAGIIGNFGLLVAATDKISLYASNFNEYTYDVTDVLPEEALSSDYIVQTYTPLYNSEFMIVATQDGTTVRITPSTPTSDNHAASVPYNVTLNAGQTYLVTSYYNGPYGDLSGSTIQSIDATKPIAVFNGNVCALVPMNNSACDHVVEQAFGTQFWGKQFVVTNTVGMPYDEVKITAFSNNTVITKDGSYLTTLQAYESYEFSLSSNDISCYIEATNPCAVYLYVVGGQVNDEDEEYRGDPSMVWISPLEQGVQGITFSTFSSVNLTAHYVNIVVPTSAVSTFTYDNTNISSLFSVVPTNPDYSYVRMNINEGTHTLSCSQGFVAHVYGTGSWESYAYSVGANAALQNSQMYVNGVLSTEMDNNVFCAYETIFFDASVNYQCDSVVWNFGDSHQNYNGMNVSHSYESGGTYLVSMTVFLYDRYGQHCNTINWEVEILDGTHNSTTETACESFTWTDGTDETYTESGTYTYDYTNEFGCASTDTLHLTIYYGTHNATTETACESFTWTDGTGETYTTSGTYTYDYENEDGCASTDTLHLTVYYGTHNVATETACESFTWTDGTGETYTESGTYTYDYENEDGCASTDTLHLTVHYGTHNATTETACESFTWTDGTGETYTTSGTYTYDYENEFGCASTDTLHLTVYFGTHNAATETVCESYTWTDGTGETYTTSGTYTYDYENEFGCASTDTLHLTIYYGTHIVTTETACESYTWTDGTGETYTESGTYTYNYTNELGCASTDTLYLTIHYGTHNTTTEIHYQSFTWTDGTGETYTTSGTYTYDYENEFGCASTDTLYLTIYYGTHNTTTETDCESFTWNDGTGETYTESGTYTYDYTDELGYASTDTLHLTIHYGTHNTTTETACETFTWTDGTGETYTTSGTYIYDYTNEFGCASTDTLHLTVHYGTHNTSTETACESYTWTDGTGATYTTSGLYTYDYENEFGCASTDTLHLTVHYGTHNVTTETACETFTWTDGTGETYTTSGTYTYDYTNELGCASTDTLHLTVHYGTHNTSTETACESFTWTNGTGTTYTTSGTYTYDYENEFGCASTDTLHLTVHYGTHNTSTETACESYTWTDGTGTTYTTSGTYTYDYENEFGCASTDTLHLTIHYGTHNVTTETACETFTWTDGTGETYTTSGTYTYDYTNEFGCASTDTLHLTVHYGTHNTSTETACESYTWTDGTGETYTTSGTYTYDYTNEFGCASTDTLHLTVHYGTHNVTTETACESFTWTDGTGETYTTSGTYTYDYENEFGCASTDTLHLTVHYGTHNTSTETACESYTWTNGTGETYTTSGTYTYDYTNEFGCASTDTLHLTVHYGTHNVTTETACESYTWTNGTGETYTTSGTYTYDYTNELGCASTDTLHLTVHYGTHNTTTETACESFTWTDGTGETYTTSGTYTYDYTNEFGCASTETLQLTIHYGTHNAITETACESYTWTNGTGETYTTSGTYTYDYENEFGCASTDTLHLTLHYGTHNVATETACESFTWTDGTGETYTTSGTYTYDYENEFGCISSDTLHLTVHSGTHNAITDTVCESYTWTDGSGETYTTSGTYTYDYENEFGCISSDTLYLTILYGTHNTSTETVCESYTWTDGTGETYTTSGTYTYDYENELGCASTDTLHLTVYYSAQTNADTTICASALPIEWRGVTFTESGTQSFILTTSHGCDSIVALTLNSINDDLQIIMLTEDPCENFEAELLAQTGMSEFHWSTGEITPQITALHSGTYFVTASEGYCSATNSISIPECDFFIYLPNAITSTFDDGLNDYFFVPQYSQRQINDFEILIYNRWGQLVYRSEDKNFRWDGSCNGKIMGNTTYTYMIHCTNYNGKKYLFKGIITVL